VERRVKPHILPLSNDEITDDVAAILPKIVVAGGVTAGRSNIMRTLVRHPELFQRWTALLDGLLNGRLADRDREILVLRTAWNCQSEYEWGQHVSVGRRIGLSDEEIRNIATGQEAARWSDTERLLLVAADELHRDSAISDATWTGLARSYDEQEMIEIVIVVGHYHLVAMMLKSVGVPADDGLPDFEVLRQP
jgi:4-carboxymuconolactone decarboxylase